MDTRAILESLRSRVASRLPGPLRILRRTLTVSVLGLFGIAGLAPTAVAEHGAVEFALDISADSVGETSTAGSYTDYVDAALGDDANLGTSEAGAWKTLSRAGVIHHNFALDNDTFTELGSSRSADNTFAYNVVRSSLAFSRFLTHSRAEEQLRAGSAYERAQHA